MKTGRILVVEDDALIADLLRESLEALGNVVLEASSAAAALDAARGQGPDLIFMDVHLGAESGLDVMRNLREDPATRDIPLVAVTGATEPDELTALHRAGAVALLEKPFDMAELTALVGALFEALEDRERPPDGAPGNA